LIRGTVSSFGDIITRDQYSNVHLVVAGHVGDDTETLMASPMLATVIEAMAKSYDHVVMDLGSVTDGPVEPFAALSQRAVLVTGDAAHPLTRSMRDHLQIAGFANISVCAGGVQMAAA
jgi:succinoglycan biosynthesis transport protein ExoP